MATWYRVARFHDDIKPVEVHKESEKTLEINSGGYVGRRAKLSNDEQFFPTYDEARDHLLPKLKRALNASRKRTVELEQDIAALES